MSDDRRERLAARYDDLLGLFELQWRSHGHQSVHFGYYDDAHDDPGSAMVNTTRKLAEVADVGASDRVLDLGCGGGGDAVWLATECGADVVGVDLVVAQLELGKERAVEAGVDDRVTFWRDDYHELRSVDDGSIDVAWALESLSHSSEPATVTERVREALAPDGLFVVADVFLADADVERTHAEHLDAIESDMGLRFRPLSAFLDDLEDAGFTAIEHWDVTPAVMPGADRSTSSSSLFGPLSSVGSALGLTPDAASEYFDFWSNVHELFQADTAGYHFVRARVPDRSES